MTIVEQIRAEVERLKETAKLMKLSTYKSGWNSAMNAVLQLLSTLEKEREKPMNSNEGLEEEFIRYIHEKDAEVSERGESTYAQEDLEDIARHFAKWGAEHLATPAK